MPSSNNGKGRRACTRYADFSTATSLTASDMNQKMPLTTNVLKHYYRSTWMHIVNQISKKRARIIIRAPTKFIGRNHDWASSSAHNNKHSDTPPPEQSPCNKWKGTYQQTIQRYHNQQNASFHLMIRLSDTDSSDATDDKELHNGGPWSLTEIMVRLTARGRKLPFSETISSQLESSSKCRQYFAMGLYRCVYW